MVKCLDEIEERTKKNDSKFNSNILLTSLMREDDNTYVYNNKSVE